MPLFVKPQFNSVWAATGTKLTPDSAKISQGWIVEIPPHEYENWSQNRQDALLAHINQVGIPMWDATVEYQAGKSYIQGSTTGNIYRAVTTNTNVNPELDIQGNWVVAFEAQGAALLKSQNLADVPDKALARSNLGIPDTVFYDGRYLQRSNNLSDVTNAASARNNLGLGNSATRNVGTGSNTVAAGDDSRIVNAVPNTRIIGAGWGLAGGGNLSNDVFLALGTPSTVSRTSTNTIAPGTHYHALDVNSFLPTVWGNYTGQRFFNTNYTNTTGKFIFVSVSVQQSSGNNIAGLSLYISGVLVARASSRYSEQEKTANVSAIVPPGATYAITDTTGFLLSWAELR